MQTALILLGSISISTTPVINFTAANTIKNGVAEESTTQRNNFNSFLTLTSKDIKELDKIQNTSFFKNLIFIKENNSYKFDSNFIQKNNFSNKIKKFLSEILIDTNMYSLIRSHTSFYRNLIVADGNIIFESPRIWYEWIGGVWRLHLSAYYSQGIVDGTLLLSDLAGIISENVSSNPWLSAIANIGKLAADIIALLASNLMDTQHGTRIRFLFWIMPTSVDTSDYNW
ncbi:hypothetical protein [Williamsoniiplasma lucivorax]|uniref:Uncharacterized protein n=1 Tax=Williamsoniiplasma lucivorax TaxID=209274 RepID=A0A2S5RDP7_9MOLU|nr:hypothetical protein [Williamsoniiplasma lucivorax]PPE05427.1 hypothetical protein ELUCI_v1c05190 [Williamsoniiplasma lucivorax]